MWRQRQQKQQQQQQQPPQNNNSNNDNTSSFTSKFTILKEKYMVSRRKQEKLNFKNILLRVLVSNTHTRPDGSTDGVSGVLTYTR